MSPPLYLVSACLAGLLTRYDGSPLLDDACRRWLAERGALWIPFCPEQLGGLPTPRPPADLVAGDGEAVLAGRGRVVTGEGVDVTLQFVRGAEQALFLARSQPIAGVLLKARSPSCGLTPRIGVTAALLRRHGFRLVEF